MKIDMNMKGSLKHSLRAFALTTLNMSNQRKQDNC